MSSSFFAGNAKTILVKKQVDADTAVTDFTDAMALRVYEFTRPAPRAISPLNETDNSQQASANHVTALQPSVTFGCYGRPAELALIAEALLGDDDDTASSPVVLHTATVTNEMPWYSILEINPYGNTRWEGCRLGAATFTAQDEGETEFRVTGLAWQALGYTDGVGSPSPIPDFADELPFIYAECTVKYAGASEGRTSQFAWNINRNLTRAQGDNGFTAIGLVPGKLQNDGQVTRYTADDDMMRAVDTGTEGGTVPTSAIFTEGLAVLFDRGSGATHRQFLIASDEVAYQDRQEAIDLDGKPLAEVLTFANEPQADVDDNITIITLNELATPAG